MVFDRKKSRASVIRQPIALYHGKRYLYGVHFTQASALSALLDLDLNSRLVLDQINGSNGVDYMDGSIDQIAALGVPPLSGTWLPSLLVGSHRQFLRFARKYLAHHFLFSA